MYAPEDVNDHFHRPGIISRVGFEVVEGHDLHYDLADAGEVKMKGKHLRYAIEAKFGTFEDAYFESERRDLPGIDHRCD